MALSKDVVIKVQGKNADIVSGVSIVMQCCEELKTVRVDIDSYLQHIFEHSRRIAEHSDISISMPRVSQRQQSFKPDLQLTVNRQPHFKDYSPHISLPCPHLMTFKRQ